RKRKVFLILKIYKRFDRIDEIVATLLAVLLGLLGTLLRAIALIAASDGKYCTAVFTFSLCSHTRIFLSFFYQIRVSLPRVNQSQPLTTHVNPSHEITVLKPHLPPLTTVVNHRKPM
ncbi:MAG: hypothetical protein K2K27_01290, partial [Muribaculaceae bacterium]|nr:hypothetical protein [Muribaculaceae bacterium]